MLAQATLPQLYALKTRSGEIIQARAVSPEDEALLADFFDRVSDEDRRFRFLSPRKHLTHEQLTPLVDVDHDRTESFIALDPVDGGVVAHAMLACDAALDTAEVAIAVCSSWRGRGVGWAMLDLVGEAARQRGVRRVIAIEDRDNHAAIELEREKGFAPHAVEGEPHVVMLEKLLR